MNFTGEYFSLEQKSTLQASMLILQVENDLKTMYIWGKIKGIQNDYYIVHGHKDGYFQSMKYFYSINLHDWTLVPTPKNIFYDLTASCSCLFLGVPSHSIEITILKNGKPHSSVLKEEERLAAVIKLINQEVSVIPKGAFYTLPNGMTVKNKSFPGLKQSDAKDLKNYIHFEDKRKSEELFPYWNSEDSIDKDFPQKGWQVQLDVSEQVSTLRSLMWPGLVLLHTLHSPEFTRFYIGDGRRNHDIYFML